MSQLTHFDATGEAHMVDVGEKAATRRVAVASGRVHMRKETLATIRAGQAGKGDVLGVARIAAIQGTKRTAELIPLCHQVALSHVEVVFSLDDDATFVECQVRAETIGPTGVEMEALTGVSVALLTIYDMCKAMDRGMRIDGVRLLKKSGGRSGLWQGE